VLAAVGLDALLRPPRRRRARPMTSIGGSAVRHR
jgi:hypothetical protein